MDPHDDRWSGRPATAQVALDLAPPRPAHPVLSLTSVALGVATAVAAHLVLAGDEFASLFLAGALVGGSHAGLMWAAHREDEPLTIGIAGRVARGASAGSVLVVAGGCLAQVIGVLGAVVVLGLVVGIHAGLRHHARRTARPSDRVVADAVPDQVDLLLPPLPGHSTAELTDAWLRSQQMLRRTTGARDRARLVALREAYLDELERRDAGGVRRWLESGRALSCDPRPFLHDSGPDDPRTGTR